MHPISSGCEQALEKCDKQDTAHNKQLLRAMVREQEINVVRVLLGSIMSLMLMGASVLSGGMPDCSLEVRSGDGSPISMVGSEVSFQVIVVMRNCSEQPQVSLDKSAFAMLRRVSIQTRIINGNSSISYVYSARIDHTVPMKLGLRVSV